MNTAVYLAFVKSNISNILDFQQLLNIFNF